MIRRLVIFILICNTAFLASAQDASIRLWGDQQVFISGEDIWFDGIMQNGKPVSKTLMVQLLDRNGNKKAEAEVVHNGNKFRGLITVPSNLPSDYYFLDAHTPGVAVKTALFPIMVIHPKIPPSMGCNFTPTKKQETASSVNVYTDKEAYAPRSEVKTSLTGLTEIKDVYVSVIKYDELNAIYEQAANGFNTEYKHNETNESFTEGKGFVFTAKKNGNPVAELPVLAALKGSSATIAIGNTDDKGMVKFIFPYKYEIHEIVLHTLSNEKGIVFESQSKSNTTPIIFPCLKLDEASRPAIESRLMHLNITKQFYANLHRTIENKTTDTTDFYGKPDIRYYLDEYVRFPNMEEVFAEIIAEVRVKKNKDISTLQVLNIPFKYFFTNEPLILVDGIPYYNTKELLESDPLLIKSIDVVYRKYILGNHEFDGIVHFKTYRNDMGSLKISDADRAFTITGIQKSTMLEPAFQKNALSTMPDFRNLVFKKSDIPSDFRGSAVLTFKTSDAVGTYQIITRGLDKSGKVHMGYKTIIISN